MGKVKVITNGTDADGYDFERVSGAMDPKMVEEFIEYNNFWAEGQMTYTIIDA